MDSQLNLFSLKEQRAEVRDQKSEEQKISSPISNPPSPQIKYNSLEEAKSAAMKCTKCILCKGRTNVVFSDGPENSKIMIIGEGPGENED